MLCSFHGCSAQDPVLQARPDDIPENPSAVFLPSVETPVDVVPRASLMAAWPRFQAAVVRAESEVLLMLNDVDRFGAPSAALLLIAKAVGAQVRTGPKEH